jgi:hypothetical protein
MLGCPGRFGPRHHNMLGLDRGDILEAGQVPPAHYDISL